MTVEVILAVALWSFPVAAAAGYYAAGYHLRRIVRNGTKHKYPGYIQTAADRYEEENEYLLDDEFLYDN